MTPHVLILGAGFGGLELATRLSESLADQVRVTLLDGNDSFSFGFSKLDVLLGKRNQDEVRLAYAGVARPGIEFRREVITAIDPQNRHVRTESGSYEADVLAVALGAEYDPAATPGFTADGYEYYSLAGAERLRGALKSSPPSRLSPVEARTSITPSKISSTDTSKVPPPRSNTRKRVSPSSWWMP